MAADNRLTSDELMALTPGDNVTIESGHDFARRRYTTGTVARMTDRHVVVRCGAYVECYGLRDGIRDGGAGRAELVRSEPLRGDQVQRKSRQIHRLAQLHAAIGEVLEESTVDV